MSTIQDVDITKFAFPLDPQKIVALETTFNTLDENGLRSIAGAGRDMVSKLLSSHYENGQLILKYQDLQKEYRDNERKLAIDDLELGQVEVMDKEQEEAIAAKIAEYGPLVEKFVAGQAFKSQAINKLGGLANAMGGMLMNISQNKSLVEYWEILADGFVTDFSTELKA